MDRKSPEIRSHFPMLPANVCCVEMLGWRMCLVANCQSSHFHGYGHHNFWCTIKLHSVSNLQQCSWCWYCKECMRPGKTRGNAPRLEIAFNPTCEIFYSCVWDFGGREWVPEHCWTQQKTTKKNKPQSIGKHQQQHQKTTR